MSRRAFDSRKACVLAGSDLSPKGSVDEPIAADVAWLNAAWPEVCTTSSCSGRVALYAHAGGGVTKGGAWLVCSHEPAAVAEVESALVAATRDWSAPGAGNVVLRFEPFILTCACATLDAARVVVRAALGAGLRESGLVSWPGPSDAAAQCVVTVRGSLRLEVPIVAAGQRIVSPQALATLVGLANGKFDANAAKTRRFFDALRDSVASRCGNGPIDAQKRKSKTRACNTCGQAGHLAAACPLRAQRTRTADAPPVAPEPAAEQHVDEPQARELPSEQAAPYDVCPLECARFSSLVQPHETVAHLCAGAGELVLSALGRGAGAGATSSSCASAVVAMEWRPDQLHRLRAAVHALPQHLAARVVVVDRDARECAAHAAPAVKPHCAHRVLVPDASPAWLAAALRLVRLTRGGGVVHVPVPAAADAAAGVEPREALCEALRAAAPAAGVPSRCAVAARVVGVGVAHTAPASAGCAHLTVDVAVEAYDRRRLQTASLELSTTRRPSLPSVACPHRHAFATRVLHAPLGMAAGSPFALEPVVLEEVACVRRAVGRWTPQYMAAAGGDVTTSCHISTDPRGFDLAGHKARGGTLRAQRNFSFVDAPFADAIARCCDGAALPPLIGTGERVYIRTVGASARAHVPDVLPALAADVDITCACDPDAGPCACAALVHARQYHSSCLRISGAGTRLFCHYDTVDNVLLQITGDKTVVLFHPRHAHDLYVSGSACRVPPDVLLRACGVHVDGDGGKESIQAAGAPSEEALAALAHAWPRALRALPHARVVHLTPGTGVFIPALWLHCVATSAGCAFSAGVNVFFRAKHEAQPGELYDPADDYGNRDSGQVARCCADVAKASKAMTALPHPWRGATARRCAALLQALLDDSSDSDNEEESIRLAHKHAWNS